MSSQTSDARTAPGLRNSTIIMVTMVYKCGTIILSVRAQHALIQINYAFLTFISLQACVVAATDVFDPTACSFLIRFSVLVVLCVRPGGRKINRGMGGKLEQTNFACIAKCEKKAGNVKYLSRLSLVMQS